MNMRVAGAGLATGILTLFGQLSCVATAPSLGSMSPGEALYREHCNRCHDPVPPHAYSDDQWRGVIGRMQPEAGLSDAEAASILGWLQRDN